MQLATGERPESGGKEEEAAATKAEQTRGRSGDGVGGLGGEGAGLGSFGATGKAV